MVCLNPSCKSGSIASDLQNAGGSVPAGHKLYHKEETMHLKKAVGCNGYSRELFIRGDIRIFFYNNIPRAALLGKWMHCTHIAHHLTSYVQRAIWCKTLRDSGAYKADNFVGSISPTFFSNLICPITAGGGFIEEDKNV